MPKQLTWTYNATYISEEKLLENTTLTKLKASDLVKISLKIKEQSENTEKQIEDLFSHSTKVNTTLELFENKVKSIPETVENKFKSVLAKILGPIASTLGMLTVIVIAILFCLRKYRKEHAPASINFIRTTNRQEQAL